MPIVRSRLKPAAVGVDTLMNRVRPMSPRRSISRQLSELQAACRACTRCVEDGIIGEAGPCFEGGPEAVFFLVGQAPGPTEVLHHRPFMGRAGRILSRWMARAGF